MIDMPAKNIRHAKERFHMIFKQSKRLYGMLTGVAALKRLAEYMNTDK
ncbi:MAG: hypothetical protein LBE22_11420 [Azoarcus sp.]|jgi:hypothetical protein|nr:hypothetical protein [Azoarcus sp.]